MNNIEVCIDNHFPFSFFLNDDHDVHSLIGLMTIQIVIKNRRCYPDYGEVSHACSTNCITRSSRPS